MASLARKARRVYREEGPVSLARRATAFAYNQTRHRLREAAWRLRGEHTLRVAGVETTFLLWNLTEARGLRYLDGHERSVLSDVLAELDDDDVFFDIGANIGYYTCFAAAHLPPERVVGFEPYPPNARRLRENLRRNDRDADVRALALADDPGTVAFDRASMRSGYAFAALASVTDAGDDTIEVDAETGDRLVASGDIPRPTVVKIDVEGAEPLVIEGMRETLAEEDCRLVYCEVHRGTGRSRAVESFGGSETGIHEALTDLGFAVEELLDRDDEVYLKAVRR
jgi:FkbM family methyltransferase